MSIRDNLISVVGPFKQEIYCDYCIPIEDISSFKFEEHSTTIHLKIFLKNNAKIKSDWLEDKNFQYLDNFYFILDDSFKRNDMFARITRQ